MASRYLHVLTHLQFRSYKSSVVVLGLGLEGQVLVLGLKGEVPG